MLRSDHSLSIIYFLALIISGGSGSASYTVEAFVPATGEHCKLPNIPAKPNSWELGPRFGHSMEGLKICSGGPQTASRANCISLTDGTWKVANVLRENRLGLKPFMSMFFLQ